MRSHIVVTQLKLHVDIFRVFKTAFEFDDVRVIHDLMEFDFGEELQRSYERA